MYYSNVQDVNGLFYVFVGSLSKMPLGLGGGDRVGQFAPPGKFVENLGEIFNAIGEIFRQLLGCHFGA